MEPAIDPATPAPRVAWSEIFDDPDTRTRVPVSAMRTIQVFKLPDPGDTSRPASFLRELPPDAKLADLGRVLATGLYEFRGWNDGCVARRVMGVESARPDVLGAARAGQMGPLFETASGLAAVQGLDPNVQLVLLLTQQMLATVREDAAHHTASMVQIVQAVCARPEPQQAPQLKALTEMLSEVRGDVRAQQLELKKERDENIRLAVDRAKNSGSPLNQLLGKLTDQVDPVMGLMAAKLAPPGTIGYLQKLAGGGPAQLPAGGAAPAPAPAPTPTPAGELPIPVAAAPVPTTLRAAATDPLRGTDQQSLTDEVIARVRSVKDDFTPAEYQHFYALVAAKMQELNIVPAGFAGA